MNFPQIENQGLAGNSNSKPIPKIGNFKRGYQINLTRDISDMLHRFFLKTGIIVLGTLHILKIAYSFGLLKFALGDIDTKSFECNDITILNCSSITCFTLVKSYVQKLRTLITVIFVSITQVFYCFRKTSFSHRNCYQFTQFFLKKYSTARDLSNKIKIL